MMTSSTHPLRERLAAAKLAGRKIEGPGGRGPGYEFNNNEQAADRAMPVIAAWFRDLAEMRDSSWLGVDPWALADERAIVARALNILADQVAADSISPEATP